MNLEYQLTQARINRPDKELVFNDGAAVLFNKYTCDAFSFQYKNNDQGRVDSPTEGGEGKYIVQTRSGNEYIVADGFIINSQKETTYDMPEGMLPPDIIFDQPWKFGGDGLHTSEVMSVVEEKTLDESSGDTPREALDMETPFTHANELLAVAAEKRKKNREKLGNVAVSHAESVAETDRTRLGLPKGFKTEKGSVYKYTDDAHSERWKFDGTYHDPMGVAIFVEGTPENMSLMTRDSAISNHIPPEERFKSYVMEYSDDRTTARKVYDARDIKNPNNMMFARVNGKNEFQAMLPASIQPTVGYCVYEISKTKDGKGTRRHPGHMVSEIIA